MTKSGLPPHDPAAEHCGCWSCDNVRRVAAYKVQHAKDHEAARAATRGLVVTFMGVDTTRRADIFAFLLDSHQVISQGTLSEVLQEHPATPATDAFLRLDLLQRQVVLDTARRRGDARVGEMVDLWDSREEDDDGR
jgi:hypothetical protein